MWAISLVFKTELNNDAAIALLDLPVSFAVLAEISKHYARQHRVPHRKGRHRQEWGEPGGVAKH